jgi:DNA-directed RNA polymerase subunit omega
MYVRMNAPTGTILPDADVLNQFGHGRFVLSNLAAKRAKQLRAGAQQLVRCNSTHPLSIALAEIAAGKIRPILIAAEPALAVVEAEAPALSDEILAERGMLLPALEETETILVSSIALDEDEDVEHHDEEADGASLADLLEDHVADDATPLAEVDAGTVSLSDVAEQESLEEEEDELGR